jgi:NADH dehydrogenase FAD-containing subunit
MGDSKTVVVLGGGVGGVVAARELRNACRARVVLIDQEPEHLLPLRFCG